MGLSLDVSSLSSPGLVSSQSKDPASRRSKAWQMGAEERQPGACVWETVRILLKSRQPCLFPALAVWSGLACTWKAEYRNLVFQSGSKLPNSVFAG